MEVDAARPDRDTVSPRGDGGPRLRRALLAVALVLAVALAAGLWLWQSRELAQTERARAEDRAALNAATALTMAWASVDHRRVDDYVETVLSGSTGPFLEQFENAEPFLRQTLTDNKSVQVPTIPKDGAALLERSDDEARVIVAMDASVSNQQTDEPQPRQYRLQVQLQRVDGRWLVSGLEFIDDST